MNTIFIAVFSVTIVGASCAIMLCIAAKVMHVHVDERLELLHEIMPGVNCGACGYPGCTAYAEAMLSNSSVKTNLCTPGGADVAAKVSAVLGIEAESVEKKIAVVRCSGDCQSHERKMEYSGIQSCQAAKHLFGGEGACAFGCIGYGDCKVVCPTGAICIEDSLARVIPELCTGCGLCVKACPNDLITIESSTAPVAVLCSSIEKGAIVRGKCSSGCIACTKCVRECPERAITIEENLAIIDYNKCIGCEHCVDVCITKCIRGIKA
ncbi:MAG: RnfABCDGE type electron transport complex subunit B [Treponema sp.]|nr:RnfABCDGE type electron transport complex subunit B [Treponema sp.]